MKYEKPVLEIIKFEDRDIVTVSVVPGGDGQGLNGSWNS